jgi:O-methyltransferase
MKCVLSPKLIHRRYEPVHATKSSNGPCEQSLIRSRALGCSRSRRQHDRRAGHHRSTLEPRPSPDPSETTAGTPRGVKPALSSVRWRDERELLGDRCLERQVCSRYSRVSMPPQVADLYLDLLKRCLTRYGMEPATQYLPYRTHRSGVGGRVRLALQQQLQKRGLELAVPTPISLEARAIGADWPLTAETMIGLARLDQLQAAIEDVLANDVPGDLIETGAWRGGASIFMRAVLATHRVDDRVVWVADSFEGLPRPNADEFPVDEGDQHWTHGYLAISIDEVRANFSRYGMLDDQVRFLQGWFRDTLPGAPIQQLAVLRLDGDMYESTIQALDALYPKLSVGGYVVVDDYILKGCRAAVTDYRAAHAIQEPVREIDGTGVYWQRLE